MRKHKTKHKQHTKSATMRDCDHSQRDASRVSAPFYTLFPTLLSHPHLNPFSRLARPPVSHPDSLELQEGEFVRNIAVTIRLTDGWDE